MTIIMYDIFESISRIDYSMLSADLLYIRSFYFKKHECIKFMHFIF